MLLYKVYFGNAENHENILRPDVVADSYITNFHHFHGVVSGRAQDGDIFSYFRSGYILIVACHVSHCLKSSYYYHTQIASASDKEQDQRSIDAIAI